MMFLSSAAFRPIFEGSQLCLMTNLWSDDRLQRVMKYMHGVYDGDKGGSYFLRIARYPS